MNVVYATSDLYSRPAVVSIKSLFENSKKEDDINIYYIENGLSEENRGILTRLVKEYGGNIEFIKLPDLNVPVEGRLRTNEIVYSYCFLQDILPESVDRALLLESDAIVTDSLTDMYSMDLEGYYGAAADDFQSKWYKRRLGLKDTSPYFNSGVILYNLEKWRSDGMTEKMRDILKGGKSRFFYEIQDELNVALEGKIKLLPPRYNAATAVFLFGYKDMIRYRRPSTVCTEKEFEEAVKNPAIVHFTKNQIMQSRPWVKDCSHPYNGRYNEIKEKTEVRKEPLWDSGRGFINKATFFMYSKVSKTLTALSLGVIHAYLYPVILYKLG